MRRKIVLLGSNPSIKSATSTAFDKSTKSAQIISSWIRGIEADFVFINITDKKTPKNRPLSRREIKEALPALAQSLSSLNADGYVSLGSSAHTALTLLHLAHLEMPHPSGMNRQLNDKKFADQKIKELAAFAASPSE